MVRFDLSSFALSPLVLLAAFGCNSATETDEGGSTDGVGQWTPLPPVNEKGIGGGLCDEPVDGSVIADPTADLKETGSYGQPGYVQPGARPNGDGTFTIVMPECTQKIRGLLIQNGADNQSGVGVARLWGFAFIRGSLWAADRSHEQQLELLLKVIDEFATLTEHPELVNAPIAIQGGSRTSAFSFFLAAQRPERVIAWATDALGPNPSDASPGALKIPGVITVGQNDHYQEVVDGSMKPLREQGAFVTAGMKWNAGHETKQAHQLIWPFFDQVIRARLPADADTTKGPVELKDYPAEEAWLGNVDNWADAAPASEYTGDPKTAAWLPNAYIARVWQSLGVEEPSATMTAPLGWGRIGKYSGSINGGFASFKTPLTLVASVPEEGSEAHFYSGSLDLGAGVWSDGNLKLENVLLPAGIRPISVVLPSGKPLSRPVGITVLGNSYSAEK